MTEEQEDPGTATQVDSGSRSDETGVRLRENPREFTVWQCVQIFIASWLGYLAILLIGRTIRWQVFGWENWTSARKFGKGLIYTFWHREIFSACWFWRKRGIVVMTSQNFDGEYIARIIQKHGYGAARGSSTRGAPKALAEMAKCLKNGLDTAFTIDGPRGPRFVAKRGSVLLSKATGAAILCFHVAPEKAHVFKKSWDLNQIPYPFTRAAVFVAPPIVVPSQADIREQAQKLREVQTVLDDLRARGENWAKQQALKREIRTISPP